jgi:starch-binding outer membrane protein, SusD/RagB family
MRYRYISVIAVAALLAACDSPLETDPTASISDETALSTARGVELGVTGAYRSFQTGALYDREIHVYPELYADNLDFTSTFQTDREMHERTVTPDNVALLNMWANSYAGVNRANNVLDAIPNVSELTPAQAQRFRGEALFIRALHHFNLVRYYGGVPVVTEPARGIGPEAVRPRDTQAAVYARITADLEEAIGLLPGGHVVGRASAPAARALLAKAYLETGAWAGARDMATAVIDSGLYSLPEDYRSVFETKNNAESIFELQYSINNSNALAFWYFPASEGGRRGHAPSASLIAAYEPGDERLEASVAFDGANPYGIKFWRIASNDDNIMVLRLAEMYLIRAEANARLGAPAETVRADVNVVRDRAGLGPLPTTITAEEDLITAILQERRVELAMEGHRFFDLRRAGRAQTVLNIEAFRLLFPLPQSELDVNPELDQNPGY